MTIRKLTTAEEMLENEKIMSVAFSYCIDPEKDLKEFQEKQAQGEFDLAYGAFDEEGHMTSTIFNNQFTAFLNGTSVKMGGIGGVSTLPQYRMGGGIRSIMSVILKDAYDNGEVISSLFPFSHEFYRKFGYEIIDSMIITTFPTESVSGLPFEGTVRLFDAESDVTGLTELYNDWASNFNTCIKRDGEHMKHRLRPKPFDGNDYLYVLYRGNVPSGYVYFTPVKQDDSQLMDIKEFVFADETAFISLLSFIGRLRASYRKAKVRLPHTYELGAIVPEPYDISITNNHCMMARLVNAEKALSLLKPAKPFTVKVEDPFLPVNTGTYRVEYGKAGRTEDVPDFTCSIQTLTQLVLGYIDMTTALLKSDVTVSGDLSILKEAFTRKAICISDYF